MLFGVLKTGGRYQQVTGCRSGVNEDDTEDSGLSRRFYERRNRFVIKQNA